jgi:hypothetical protein
MSRICFPVVVMLRQLRLNEVIEIFRVGSETQTIIGFIFIEK